MTQLNMIEAQLCSVFPTKVFHDTPTCSSNKTVFHNDVDTHSKTRDETHSKTRDETNKVMACNSETTTKTMAGLVSLQGKSFASIPNVMTVDVFPSVNTEAVSPKVTSVEVATNVLDGASSLLPSLDLQLQTELKNCDAYENTLHTTNDASVVSNDTITDTDGTDNVTSHDNNCEHLDRHRRKLMNVHLASSFQTSSAMEAIRTMIPRCVRHPDDVIILGAKLYALEHKRSPNAKALLSILIDCEFEEVNIIRNFVTLSVAVEGSQGSQGESVNENSVNSRTEFRESETLNNSDVLSAVPTVPLAIPSTVQSTHQPTTIQPTTKSTHQPTALPTVQPTVLSTALPTVSPTVPSTTLLTSPLHASKSHRLSCLAAVVTNERDMLVDATTCVACKVNPREVTFLPCGHYSLCSSCSAKTCICPICQGKALAEVRTFLA